MKVSTKIIVLVVLVIIAVVIYKTHHKVPVIKKEINTEAAKSYTLPTIEADPSLAYVRDFTLSGNTLTASKGSAFIQSFVLEPDALDALALLPQNTDRFLIDYDVNFDGYIDVGVFTMTGYAGVNNYYEFYIYNPDTGSYELNSTLPAISNPSVDIAHRTVISSYRDGPVWYSQSYVFNKPDYQVMDPIKQ
ncbi:MAG: hypothetical protein RLY57_4 [Candidatus Parcubacteria bacterium]